MFGLSNKCTRYFNALQNMCTKYLRCYALMCTSISDIVAVKILAKRKMPAHIAKADKEKIRKYDKITATIKRLATHHIAYPQAWRNADPPECNS